MPRVFDRRMNVVARCSLLALPLLLATVGVVAWAVDYSPYLTQQGVAQVQPVPFSHQHHVGGLGIDCRYCHTSVQDSGFAGVPPTKTCMTCHSQIWTNAGLLEPVRESWRTDEPIRWRRVNNLPNYVYFNHSIHVAKGVGCATCHGPVDEMPLMYQAKSLQMSWCLDCHKDPAKYLRPREEVFNLHYKPPADQEAFGKELEKRYHVRPSRALIDCYTCHR
jgi:hypothetical protein